MKSNTLHEIEMWTGHRRKHSTKRLLSGLIASALLLVGIIAMSSCVTTTALDGTVTKQADEAWFTLARDLFLEPAPPVAPIVVEGDK